MIDYGTFIGVGSELTLLGGAMLLGAVLGSVYDVLRTLRLAFFHKAIAVFFEDIAFCLLWGIGWYTYCTELCDGALRLFVLIGMGVGFVLYYITVGRIVIKIVNLLLSIVGKIRKKATDVLFRLQKILKSGKKTSSDT